MAYTLYITNKNYSSWSMRPWLLMRQLSIPFHEVFAELKPGAIAQPQWAEFSPIAHVPCLYHEVDGETLVLWESISVVEHLAEEEKGKGVYPADKRARAWARSAVGEMHAGFGRIRDEMSMNVGLRIKLGGKGDVSPGLAKDLERVNQLWTEGLEKFGGPFLAGKEFTAVDAFYTPIVLRIQTFVGAVDWLSESARGYYERILELELVKEWVDAALKETGRETVHDDQSVSGREVLEDLRAKA
ncbi:glutathione S-transferase domain protein [Cercophora newfieldiana]|uniref:Glutathione S-transferase domain protein n=1 Tax=Cercophora newfieldiana TaxID=92897 RepID=A0AA39YGM9_9PEZI|nr:glutathione S-transferase domain protein [Cercophora newfieldiana]